MTDLPDPNDPDARVDSRAELLPEEERVGSEDRELQARAILQDSDERTEDVEGAAEGSQQTATR
ncbi:MAG: hypothetical protein ACTHMS_18180 [Jatrophihabitans sp.]|uniref:hypothetical protein n=1 Tax=Jatrophihabitans sp. TaxID=1932789 RepID=UPI003F822086